ncbi:high affinity copper uptake protein 1-like [Maniola hyperantus]|uniref:high affinity copper uptake protein 1-like n=1 Tax=Aphantopus hyperantus TaxID=2795564 RepID=UPI00156991FE|nr:high affinity copper uptake protein 1-like [Maniola hyperantus]
MNHNDMMAAHDHADHDHGDHGDAHSCGGHGHAMVFHAGVEQEILFRGWETTNALELFGSAVAIFLASVLYEGFKYYREALHANAVTPTGDSQVNIAKSECGARGSCAGPAVVKYSMFSSAHVVQTCLHVVQATVSYVLMLVFMTYNVWLCLALVLGLGVGYFCFGWKKSSVVDTNEHCQ